MFYVIYGKVVEDRQSGVCLSGVYFGGVATERSDAEAIARDCVNNIKGGTIIPRIFPVSSQHQLVLVMQDATKKFNKLQEQMSLAEKIIERGSKRKR